MSLNLLDMLKDQVSGTLAQQASSFLGESEEGVTKALGAGFPAILGGLIDKGSSESGAKGIMDLLGNVDGDMLGNIGGLFGGGASSVNGLLNSGGGILDAVLGNKMGGIVDLIAKVSGLKGSSSSSLLKMAAPFLMGLLKKQIAGKGISGLMGLLSSQKDHVASAMPSGMGSLLGLTGIGEGLKATASKVGDTVGDTGRAAAATAEKAASSGLGWLKWLLPILIVAGLAWWLMGKGDVTDAVGDAVDKTTSVVKDGANAAGNVVKDGADAVANAASAAWTNVNEAAKEGLASISFGANSIGKQIMDFVDGGAKGDAKFRFNELSFRTGSADIEGNTGKEIDNLAAVLKAYPGVNVEIGGHTDNTGDEAKNQTLSEMRAAAIMGRLIAQDIAPSRITTKGYGSTMPVASNDSPEGRAQNRRIEVTMK